MSSKSPWRTALFVALIAITALACQAAEGLLTGGIQPPDSVSARALGLSSVRVDWSQAGTARKYRIERRTNLSGTFQPVTEVATTVTSYFDTGLDPETFYGYRIISLDRVDEASPPSVVAGARTAPLPGIELQARLGGSAALADPNGYRVVITGPRDTTLALAVVEDRIVSPLPAGSYTVRLQDVSPTCNLQPASDSLRTVVVADTGLTTRSLVQFTVGCFDPTLGTIIAIVNVQGDSTDPDGYRVAYAGIIPGDTLPAIGGVSLGGDGGTSLFTALRPGDYQVTLSDVDLPCTITGSSGASVQVAAQSIDTVRFQVTCPDKGGGNPNAPFILRNLWNPQAAPAGQTVTLDISLDLSATPSQTVGSVQASFTYNAAALTYVSGTAPAPSLMNNLTVNAGTPGTVSWLNFTTGSTPPTGVVPVARFTFQVNGSSGATSQTRSTIDVIGDFTGSQTLETQFRSVEDTFTVGTGGGGGGNQSPTAQAGGPYSGAAGATISFSSTGSTDPDGTISSYQWSFGDGTTSTQANPSKSYSAAGNFTATLTVTDNGGATGTDQATVTITGGGGGNQAPVAQAGGPYSGTAGSAVAFSSSGSTDPDGTIASYLWDFGDGTTSTQANPSKSYSAAGNFTLSLTVTDNLGATGTAQASATISPPSSSATLTGNFGPLDPSFNAYPLTLTLALPQDLSQTAGSPEALATYVVDSLVWDSSVVQYHSLTYLSNSGGSFNPTDATGGCKCKLIFSGGGLTPNTGVIPLAIVRFRPVGVSGASTTARVFLGPVLSTPALGSFNYRSLITVTNGNLTLP
ncbi:MAG: PKD domain-containing protein [Gemmatimonadota bacterium]|nr:PKD domain-containing protein [Gemmatimonadota bacterium]